MSTQDAKQGVIDLFLKLINGAWALPTIIVVIVGLWSRMTTEQICRVKELQPLLNSSIGIAFAVILVVSYLSNVISSPIKEMTTAVIELKSELHDVSEALKDQSKHIESQFREIQVKVTHIEEFFTDK